MMAEQPATAAVAMVTEQAATTVAAAMMSEQSATASAAAVTSLDRFASEHGAADQQRDCHSNTHYITTHSNSLRYKLSY